MSGQRNISGVPVTNVTGTHRACYSTDCGCRPDGSTDFRKASAHLRTCETATCVEYHPHYISAIVALRKVDL